MVMASKIGGLVGAGKFFKGVSSRMAYALPIGHPMGKRSGSHAASSRPSSFHIFETDFMAKERAKGFLGYNPDLENKMMVLADDRILLGVLPMCSMIFGGNIYRSDASEIAFFLDATTGEPAQFTSYAKLKEVAGALGQAAFMKTVPVPTDPTGDLLAPAVKLPINCMAGGDGFGAFPAFDLYASRIDAVGVSDEPHSWPTIKLASASEMTEPYSIHAAYHALMLPDVGGCQDWLVWMQPAADVPECAFMRVHWDVLTAGK